MQPYPFLHEPLATLHAYISHAPSMLLSVDDSQYLKLQTKYKHLILKYINNYNSLQKLKQIEREIPEIILNHVNVKAELKGIEQIKKKLDGERERERELGREIQEREGEMERLKVRVREKKEELILEKREYMRLRKGIDEIELKETPPASPQKYIFSTNPKSPSPSSLLPLSTFTNNWTTPPLPSKLDTLTSFKIGLKALPKKQFHTISTDIHTVLKNIRINKNISSVSLQNNIKRRTHLKQNTLLPTTKCTSRKYMRRKTEKENGLIFHRGRLESRESTGRKEGWEELAGLSSVELYERVCMEKEGLDMFMTMLNDLIYKKNY